MKLHTRNHNTIFCRICDEFISLEDKLKEKHVHKSDSQPKSIIEYTPSRDRSRSPIKDFFSFNAFEFEFPNTNKHEFESIFN